MGSDPSLDIMVRLHRCVSDALPRDCEIAVDFLLLIFRRHVRLGSVASL